MLAGIPAFALAVPLNWLLVEQGGVSKSAAYATVLIAQMTINFLICRWFVFSQRTFDSLIRQYVSFISGNAMIRLLDWVMYAVIVSFLPSAYLLVQLANAALFSLVKFSFARLIFARKPNRT
jgi:putative flippase GtrA